MYHGIPTAPVVARHDVKFTRIIVRQVRPSEYSSPPRPYRI